jgi:lipopolysaccharide export system ATP-binding protein
MGIIRIKKFRIKSYKKNVKPLLSLKEITKSYDSQPILDKINIQVMPSSVVGLLGPNGSGKTTIFNLIMGIIKADSGKIIFNNKEIQNKPINYRGKMGIGIMMQERPVFDLNLQDNLYAVAECLMKDKQKQKEVVERLIRDFGLDSLRKQPARNLSGGQRAKLCLARTLVNSPKLVLIDEGTSGLDPISVQEVSRLILRLQSFNVSLLVTSHVVGDVIPVCDKIYVLADTKVIDEGTPAKVLRSQISKEKYFGDYEG